MRLDGQPAELPSISIGNSAWTFIRKQCMRPCIDSIIAGRVLDGSNLHQSRGLQRTSRGDRPVEAIVQAVSRAGPDASVPVEDETTIKRFPPLRRQ
jgi:hypothetical protein